MLAYLPARQFDPPRLFIASVSFALFLRTISFVTLAILYWTNVKIGSDGSATVPGDPLFFQRVLSVIFNVADWTIISSYLLLVIVWIELLGSARSHYFSRTAMRRDWMYAFVGINIAMYATQIG